VYTYEKRHYSNQIEYMGKLSVIPRGFDKLLDFLALFCAVLMIFMLVSVNYAVVLRYLFRGGVVGILEIWEYMVLYVAFLGSAWQLRRKGHVGIDVLSSRLKPKSQATLSTVTYSLCALVTGTLCWFGTKEWWEKFTTGVRLTETELEVFQYLVLWVVPFGFLLLTIQFLRHVYHFIRERETAFAEEKGLLDDAG